MEKELMLAEEKREIEILEFRAGGNAYGIDINDIREILPYDKKSRKIPNSHPYIEGVIMPRDFVIPIIDLVASLKLEDVDDEKLEMLIVTSIKDMNIGFHVDQVEGIYRTTTANISKPGRKLSTSVKGVVSGILTIDGKKIEILELRNIINDINSDIDLR
ncbi:MAG: purine-binding chemotaxis protein CheW [Clostridiales bacterium]|jgi:two-component system chemotaxis response regulator CheV|nr:purine-binding chemotaxis protein CheW [Clostridiales bacterium]